MAATTERWECPNCGTPLNIAALGIYAKVACPSCGHVDHVHTMLANFRLEGLLGLGGMSVVLRARDLVLDRPLAIKLLNEFYRDQPERIARFEQECELMAKVRHENVVSVYSAGRVKGQFYIAMELINGRNLEELVQEQGPMEPMRALNVLRQVVHGLDAACRSGLLHRDMKPGNILICDDGQAKVLDFGLSLGKRDANTEEIIWATPYYVPPETLMRQPEDARADIYSLGMTMRHLLTGIGNFDPAPEGIEQMLACKRRLVPLADIMPALPEPYCELIDHMTAYEPAGRPEDYAALMVEIAEVRATLRAEEKGAAFHTRLRRSLPLLFGAAATLTLGAGAATLSCWLATPEPERLYKTPAALSWPERHTLTEAMEKLRSGDSHAAAAAMATLAQSEGEPAACAWASLHASMLSYLHSKPEEAEGYRVFMEHHLSRPPASAGQALFEQLATLQQPSSTPDNHVLKAARSLFLAEESAATCQEQAMQRHLQDTRVALRGAGAFYAPLVALTQQREKQLLANLPARATNYYKDALSRLKVEEASRVMGMLEASASGSASRRCLAVQREALSLFSDAVEMMKRHSLLPATGEALSADKLQNRLSRLNQPTLSAEIATLMLVAQGEFERAAALNPYAQSTSSAEPFAVLMRDWHQRTRPADNQQHP